MPQTFSILTPSYNQVRYLPRTGRSILEQTGDFSLQWIVIDGGSTDGTVEWLRSQEDGRILWSSEPDKGQADALNKGLTRADGQIIGWLNSDDLYTTGALAAVAAAFDEHPDAQWIVGRCDIVDASDRPIRPIITRYKNHLLRRCNHHSLLSGMNPISQPAVFWRRDFGNRVGPLDASLHHVMDYDLWLRMSHLQRPLILDRPLARFRIHNASKSGTQTTERFAEQYAVAGRYFQNNRAARRRHAFAVRKIVWGYALLGWFERLRRGDGGVEPSA